MTSECCAARRRLRHLAAALLDAAVSAAPTPRGPSPFACTSCEGVLLSPVTAPCGHSFCRICAAREAGRECRLCGTRLPTTPPRDANVLVQSLADKWWAAELKAARLRDQGNQLFARKEIAAALRKYDDALATGTHNHLILSNRSHALLRLNRLTEALADADAVVKLRPSWAKGYYRRGAALIALGRHEDALLALCLCAALEGSATGVRREVSRVLQRLLSAVPARSRPAPYPAKRPRTLRHCSDCEDSSSGDEDSSQIAQQRMTSGAMVVLQENAKLHSLLEKLFREIDNFKYLDVWNTNELAVDPQLVEQSDFDCVLCCRTLWRPVTTPCGHTYCWICLDRCLDYSCACPLCMAPLGDYLTTSPRNVTEFVERALRLLLPGEYAARQELHHQELVAGPHVPMFVCTTAFPCVACPLYVYEPRYRVMVRRCVDSGTRQFGIAACLDKDAGLDRYAEYGTMLEIRDWVLLSDGCSILTTVGMRRFRVLARGEQDGYDTAQVEFLRDQAVPHEHLSKLHDLHERVHKKGIQWFSSMPMQIQMEIIRTFGHMPPIEEEWVTLADGPAWPWWLLAILPLGQRLQVGILSTTSLEKRLRAIEKTLDQVRVRTDEMSQQTLAIAPATSSRCEEISPISSEGGNGSNSDSGNNSSRQAVWRSQPMLVDPS